MHKNFQFSVFCNAFDQNNGMKLLFFGKKLFGRKVHIWDSLLWIPSITVINQRNICNKEREIPVIKKWKYM
jgi:hypothetical protein